MTWTVWMLIATVVGAFAGIWYPSLVAWFKHNAPDYHLSSVADPAPLRLFKALVASLLISAIVALLGFVAFLGDAANQTALQATGLLAYVSAFTSGFTAGTVFEEPLRKR